MGVDLSLRGRLGHNRVLLKMNSGELVEWTL